ncbi:hypothetical protein LY121_003398 [Salmonella enterica]|nr:hypothetical protein [Salmonella enterica]
MFFDVKTVREGLYLLCRLGEYEDAQHFALENYPDISELNNNVNSIFVGIPDGFGKNSRYTRYQKTLNNDLINEHHIQWAKDDELGGAILWAYLIHNYTLVRNIHPRRRVDLYSKNIGYTPRMLHGRYFVTREYLPINNVYKTSRCYAAALYVLDLLPLKRDEKIDLTNDIREIYKSISQKRKTEFSWLKDATDDQLDWVWEHFLKHTLAREFIDKLGFPDESKMLSIQCIYYLMNESVSEKKLWLNSLKKNYANMKHRDKVKDKAPVNIRISPSAKKKLIKLEKKFNRNRSEVIEHLIEQAWAEK